MFRFQETCDAKQGATKFVRTFGLMAKHFGRGGVTAYHATFAYDLQSKVVARLGDRSSLTMSDDCNPQPLRDNQSSLGLESVKC